MPNDGVGDASHKRPPYPAVAPAAYHYQPDTKILPNPEDLVVRPPQPKMRLGDAASNLLDTSYLLIEQPPRLGRGPFRARIRELVDHGQRRFDVDHVQV